MLSLSHVRHLLSEKKRKECGLGRKRHTHLRTHAHMHTLCLHSVLWNNWYLSCSSLTFMPSPSRVLPLPWTVPSVRPTFTHTWERPRADTVTPLGDSWLDQDVTWATLDIRVSPGNDTNIQPGCAYLAGPLQPLWKCHQMPFYVCNKFSTLLLCLFITSVYLTNNWSLDISKPARSASSPNTIYWSIWLWWPMNKEIGDREINRHTHTHRTFCLDLSWACDLPADHMSGAHLVSWINSHYFSFSKLSG